MRPLFAPVMAEVAPSTSVASAPLPRVASSFALLPISSAPWLSQPANSKKFKSFISRHKSSAVNPDPVWILNDLALLDQDPQGIGNADPGPYPGSRKLTKTNK
jgi:hypothetical protein